VSASLDLASADRCDWTRSQEPIANGADEQFSAPAEAHLEFRGMEPVAALKVKKGTHLSCG